MSTIGTTGILTMGTRAMAAQRAAIEITGHNIANVNSSGYARQRVNLRSDIATRSTLGMQGLGVNAQNIQQLRSFMLDAQIPSNLSTVAYLEHKAELYDQVQTMIGQPLDESASAAGAGSATQTDGLSEGIDAFFNAFQSLSAEPTSMLFRQQVLLKAQTLSQKLNTISSTLTTAQTNLLGAIDQNLRDINDGLATIATFNQQIGAAEVGTANKANDLRDARQAAVEELAKKVNLSTTEEADGTLTVRLGSATGSLLVSGVFSGNTGSAGTVKLGRSTTDAPPNVTIQGWTGGVAPEDDTTITPLAEQPTSGTVAAQLDVLNQVIGDSTTGLIRDYDQIALAVSSLVNNQLALGFNLRNPPLYDEAGTAANENHLFDDDADSSNGVGAVTAANIRVNTAVTADLRRIAAASAVAEPNNGANAVIIADLRSDTTFLGESISSFYMRSLSRVGGDDRTVNAALSSQKLVGQQLTQQRDSVMGVSLDEEISNLMQFEHAFAASARLINTVDDMLKTILTLK